MKATEKQQVQAYQRAQDFLAANPLPESAAYTAQKKVLDDVVAKLLDYASDAGAAVRLSRAATRRQEALRKKLRVEHLAPIAQIARAMLREVPGIEAAFTLPAWNLKTHNLVQAAGAYRKVAADYEQTFVDAGRPQDFLAQLDAAIAALEGSGLGQARQAGSRAGAKRGIALALKRGRTAISLIDAMVTSAFADQPVILGKWVSARRVKATPGGVGGAPDVPVPEPEVKPAA
jgi:hypothetical protein